MYVVGVRFYSKGIFLLCSWQYDWQCPKPILSVAISTDILLHREFATYFQPFDQNRFTHLPLFKRLWLNYL